MQDARFALSCVGYRRQSFDTRRTTLPFSAGSFEPAPALLIPFTNRHLAKPFDLTAKNTKKIECYEMSLRSCGYSIYEQHWQKSSAQRHRVTEAHRVFYPLWFSVPLCGTFAYINEKRYKMILSLRFCTEINFAKEVLSVAPAEWGIDVPACPDGTVHGMSSGNQTHIRFCASTAKALANRVVGYFS